MDITSTISLPVGEYKLAAGKFDNEEVTVTTTSVYEPIKFYFGPEKELTDSDYTMTLAKLDEALEDLTTNSTYYEPNTDLGTKIGTKVIAWKWFFESDETAGVDWSTTAPYEGAKVADFLDTYLGDEATARTEAFKLDITVTQVD